MANSTWNHLIYHSYPSGNYRHFGLGFFFVAYYRPSITIFQRIRPSNEFEGKLAGFGVGMTSVGETPKKCNDTVDGRNPAPPGMYKIL